MNINPFYLLQEVSREYYTKILNNSRQQKLAAKLTKRWLAKHPKADKVDILDRLKKFSYDIHNVYDKERRRPLGNTEGRKGFISALTHIDSDDPWLARRYGSSNHEYQKDKAFKEFRDEVKDWRQDRFKKLKNSRTLKKLNLPKIADDIFNI